MADERALSDYEKRILSDIEEFGFFHCTVFDPKEKNPTFTYSVGFTQTLNCPEFIIFGLSSKTHSAMLWEVFHQVKDGKIPEDNQRWSNLIEGFDCISRPVHPTNIIREYLNSAMWFWGDTKKRGGDVKVFQLVWPSATTGLYPWDHDCAQEVRDLQPPLYLPNRSVS